MAESPLQYCRLPVRTASLVPFKAGPSEILISFSMNPKARHEQETEHIGVVVIFNTWTGSHKITVPRTRRSSEVQAPRHIGEVGGATVRVEIQERGANCPRVVMKAAPLHAVLHCFRLLGSAFRVMSAIEDVDPVESILLPQPTFYAKLRLNELLALDGPEDRPKFTLIGIARECGEKGEHRGIAHQVLLCLV